MTPGLVVPGRPGPVPELEADPAAVGEVATTLLAAGAQLDDLAGLAAGAGRLVSWTGVAADDYRADARRAGDEVEALSLALRVVARRVEAHARELDRLVREREDLVARGRALDHDLDALALAVTLHRALDPGAVVAAGVVPGAAAARAEQGRALQERCAGAASRAAGLEADVAAWSARVRQEEQGMVEALDRVLTLPQVERRFGGRADPADAALDRLPADRSPEAVHAWWTSLTGDERWGVIAAAPGLVGALDGLPARARDLANRGALVRDLAAWRLRRDRGTATAGERRALANAEAAEEALAARDGADGRDGVPVPALLWLYDPDAFDHHGRLDGRVAIAHGDPDHAATVAATVPGRGSDALDAGEHSERAWALLGAAQDADPHGSFATIAWLGYDAPAGGSSPEAATEAMARAGGERLADALDGLTAARGGDVTLVPVGHSYGSTTLGSALSGHDLEVARAAVVGSPGMGGEVGDVGDLGLTHGSFFVGRDHDDPVARFGDNGALGWGTVHGAGLGHDPADDRFGASRFGAEAAPGHDAHSGYFDAGSESLAELGRVVAGVGPHLVGPVTDPWWRPAHDPEADPGS